MPKNREGYVWLDKKNDPEKNISPAGCLFLLVLWQAVEIQRKKAVPEGGYGFDFSTPRG